jgi:hypothetical protein
MMRTATLLMLNGCYQGLWFLWAIEVVVGAAVAGVMLRRRASTSVGTALSR